MHHLQAVIQSSVGRETAAWLAGTLRRVEQRHFDLQCLPQSELQGVVVRSLVLCSVVQPGNRQSGAQQQCCYVLRMAASVNPSDLHPQCYGPSVTQIGGGATFAASVNAVSSATEWTSKPNKFRKLQHLLAGRRSHLSSLSAVLTAHRQR